MDPESCGRCAGWNDTPEKVMRFLRGQRVACQDNCRLQTIMRAVFEQFQTRQTRWRVVNGVVTVPIWIVEYLKMHPELWSGTDIQTSIAMRDAAADGA